MSLTGTVSAGSASLTSPAIDGQVVTFTGTFTNDSFVGSYRIIGGCAAGDQGRVVGDNIPNIANGFSGTFTKSAQASFTAVGYITQSASPSPEGSFGISGPAHFRYALFQ